jgi:hypothetical protein
MLRIRMTKLTAIDIDDKAFKVRVGQGKWSKWETQARTGTPCLLWNGIR